MNCSPRVTFIALPQVRKTFEDLYAEAVRINEGRPSLAPYAQVRFLARGLCCGLF